MTNDTYPAPNKRAKLELIITEGTQPDPAFSGTREQWEEYVFRRADHFNVVRYNSHNGSEIMTLDTFAKAIYIASGNPRSLIYAVCAGSCDAFCVARGDWEKYARITLELRSKQHAP